MKKAYIITIILALVFIAWLFISGTIDFSSQTLDPEVKINVPDIKEDVVQQTTEESIPTEESIQAVVPDIQEPAAMDVSYPIDLTVNSIVEKKFWVNMVSLHSRDGKRAPGIGLLKSEVSPEETISVFSPMNGYVQFASFTGNGESSSGVGIATKEDVWTKEEPSDDDMIFFLMALDFKSTKSGFVKKGEKIGEFRPEILLNDVVKEEVVLVATPGTSWAKLIISPSEDVDEYMKQVRNILKDKESIK